MEIKKGERIVIAKPVASRPKCSNFLSFSELLNGTANTSPSSACSKNAVTVIKPKTVKLMPVVNHAPSRLNFSQDTKACHQEGIAQAEAHTQLNNKLVHLLRSDLSSDLHQNVSSRSESEKAIESSKIESSNLNGDEKLFQPTGNSDQSFDGYNWRKYGQKKVKGSEYPRSYYKCTHPKCPVKKKVERLLDGQINEIVYMGEHNHSKPCTQKHTASGGQGEGFVSVGTVDTGDNLLQSSQFDEENEGSETKLKNQSEIGLSTHSTYPGKLSVRCNLLLTTGTLEAGVAVHDNSSNGANFEEVSKELEAEVDEPKSKRRKNMNFSEQAGILREDVQETHMVMQCSTDSEIMRDGFRWRKYGQKFVKGNSYPRSYYRCTSPKCNVRKHVERASDDPRSFITTYEGKHNHDMPIKNTNAVTSEPPSKAAISKNEL